MFSKCMEMKYCVLSRSLNETFTDEGLAFRVQFQPQVQYFKPGHITSTCIMDILCSETLLTKCQNIQTYRILAVWVYLLFLMLGKKTPNKPLVECCILSGMIHVVSILAGNFLPSNRYFSV